MTEFIVTTEEMEALEESVPCLDVFIDALKSSPDIKFKVVEERSEQSTAVDD